MEEAAKAVPKPKAKRGKSVRAVIDERLQEIEAERNMLLALKAKLPERKRK